MQGRARLRVPEHTLQKLLQRGEQCLQGWPAQVSAAGHGRRVASSVKIAAEQIPVALCPLGLGRQDGFRLGLGKLLHVRIVANQGKQVAQPDAVAR